MVDLLEITDRIVSLVLYMLPVAALVLDMEMVTQDPVVLVVEQLKLQELTVG
jgi:hypothetical protein